MAGWTLQRLRDRTFLRQQTALMAGVLCVLTVAAVAGTAAVLARRQAVADSNAALVTLARTMGDALDSRMFERYREVRNIAALAPLVEVLRTNPARGRVVLTQIQETLPEYALIGFATTDGVIRVASRGDYEGRSIADHPGFQQGLKAPAVHYAPEPVLTGSAPKSLAAITAPVPAPDGQPAGVLVARIGWGWTESVRASVLANEDASRGAALWVLADNGDVLVGPPEAARIGPALARKAQPGNGITLIDDDGGERMLTALVIADGEGDYPGLGWVVVARSPVSAALGPANRLFVSILAVGALVALAGAFLGFVFAGRTLRSLEHLRRSIDRVGRDASTAMVGWQRGSRDVVEISATIRSLLRRLGSATLGEREARAAAQAIRAEAEGEVQRLGRDIDELRRLASTDPLTGLLNRRAFAPFGEDAMAHFHRDGTPSAIVMIDIDHFKQINDTYGHAAGDTALRALGRELTSHIREIDKAARFGGEEFVALLRGADEASAVSLADRIRETVAGLTIVEDGVELRIRISAGVAEIRPGDRDMDDVAQRADEALYRAKITGRNRVVAASRLAEIIG